MQVKTLKLSKFVLFGVGITIYRTFFAGRQYNNFKYLEGQGLIQIKKS